ncbi:MAG: DMT family transporter, partial [Mesorhizobium sp.]
MPLSPNLRGALFMIVAMVGFTLNDAITKFSSESMNMAQVMLVRGAFASFFVGLLAWRRGALVNPATIGCSMAAGLTGVLIIVRPGFEGFSVYSLVALASVACCAVRDLSTKRIPQAIPTMLVSTATALAMTVLGALLLSPMGGWTPMSGRSTMLLALAAVLVLIGYQFIIMAMRSGDISFIAPFRYTALLWSILLGLVIFGDVPDLPMIVGAAIIIGSGLYALYRERVVGRQQPAAESAGPD